MTLFEIMAVIALFLVAGMLIVFVVALRDIDSDMNEVNRRSDRTYDAVISIVKGDIPLINDRLEAFNYSLTDLNNLLTQYNENLDHVIADREKLGKDVDILKETTLEFKMLVAKYAASVYDAQHEIREQMDSLGRSQQLILESMASVFHKMPTSEAKKIFGGEAHDEKPTGDEAHEDDLQDEVSGE